MSGQPSISDGYALFQTPLPISASLLKGSEPEALVWTSANQGSSMACVWSLSCQNPRQPFPFYRSPRVLKLISPTPSLPRKTLYILEVSDFYHSEAFLAQKQVLHPSLSMLYFKHGSPFHSHILVISITQLYCGGWYKIIFTFFY